MFRTRSLLAVAALVLGAGEVSAQALQSNIATVSINASKVASLSIVVNSGAAQTATLVDNSIVSFTTPVNVSTSWDVNPGLTASVTLVGYFSNPTQALANGTDYIASSLIKGRMATGTPTSFTAFTGGAVGGIGVAAGTLTLFSEAITGANQTKTRTDDLDLQIDLTGQTVTAGTYAGTLNLRAVTQ
ncbi:MAG TPA: hypothetical protein VFG84_03560 [Gemmatimonadaceae bacterium]|nr:hypothetical protein [Gemmatimonadaceae bacterium]